MPRSAKKRVGKNVGDRGLRDRNEKEDRLIKFVQENNMTVTNTMYKLPLHMARTK